MSRFRFKTLGFILLIVVSANNAVAVAFTLATYNLENYTLADRMADGVYRKNYPKTENAKAALRSVIRSLSVDVLVVQEMGGPAFLDELQRDLGAEGCVYPFALVLEAADVDRHLAVLSRYPPVSSRKHTDLSFTYFGAKAWVKRGLLELTFSVANVNVSVFVLHLKSRYTDREDDPESGIRRIAEATAVRNRILEVFPEPDRARFLIMGDFNDSKSSRTIRAILTRGKRTISSLLPAADSRMETWTHRYAKEDSYSRVDHIFVSPGLRPAVLMGAAEIFDQQEVGLASDHRPVRVTLELP